MYKKGFTLIELLIVIAIIGILSSVVVASLSSARSKGSDAAIKSGLANARAQAELFYASNGQTYSNLCSAPSASSSIAAMWANIKTMTVSSCNSDATSWALTGALKSTSSSWCVDSTLFAGYGTSTVLNPIKCY